MAKAPGRKMKVKKAGAVVAAIRSKGLNWSGSPIDVTNDDDDGDTTFLPDAFATKGLEIPVEGIWDGQFFGDVVLNGDDAAKFLNDLTLERPDGSEISGTFVITSYQETGPYQDAMTFTGTLVRSGAHTFTPAVP